MFEHLKAKGKIGGVTLKNRVFMPAMGVYLGSPSGGITDDLIAYYEARAKGGVGLIITEVTRVTDGAGICEPCQLAAYRPSDAVELGRLADVVHKYGAKLFIQLQHPGREASSLVAGVQPVAPSAIANPMGGEMPRELTTDECEALVQKFIFAAKLVSMSGADGVELHAAHGYLINEFLSPAMNKRTDKYGGSFENRMRFVTEILTGIRKAVGDRFPVSVRINGCEMLPGGIDIDEAKRIAAALEKAGASAINVSSYDQNCIEPGTLPQGNKKRLSLAVKQVVSIPVLGVSNIKDPEAAEALLEEGAVDFVGIGRGHLADAQWCDKAFYGKPEQIRRCIGCLACFSELGKLHRVKCAVNPITGREREYANPIKNGQERVVAVVGGGPAGIEAALTLKSRGFKPILFDDQPRLGGTLNTADKGYGKEKITRYADSLIAQIEACGIETRLGQSVTIEQVKAVEPVGVFIACGARPLVPNIPGLDAPNVMTAEDVLLGRKKPSGKVAVIGSGMTGLETAEALLDMDCEITMVEMLSQVGPGMYPTVVADVMGRIMKHNPNVLTGHKLLKATGQGVELCRLEDGETITVSADYIVLALGVRPRSDVVEKFEAAFDDVYAIGDAQAGGRILEATLDAHGRAFVFEPHE